MPTDDTRRAEAEQAWEIFAAERHVMPFLFGIEPGFLAGYLAGAARADEDLVQIQADRDQWKERAEKVEAACAELVEALQGMARMLEKPQSGAASLAVVNAARAWRQAYLRQRSIVETVKMLQALAAAVDALDASPGGGHEAQNTSH